MHEDRINEISSLNGTAPLDAIVVTECPPARLLTSTIAGSNQITHSADDVAMIVRV